MPTITERAAAEVKRVAAEQGADKLYLRMRVVGGGCSGFQTKLDLDPDYDTAKDQIFSEQGVDIVIDKRSLLYISDVNIDFIDDLNKRGFSVHNPSAKATCGCGSSFSM